MEDAARYLGITQEVMKKYKKACPANIHFEHGSRVGAPMPYKKFQFVFVSPEGTSASQNYRRITLLYWCRMCDYFSNSNTLSEIADHLYTRLGVVTDAGRLKKKESNNGTKVGFMVQVTEELKRLLREQVECGQVSDEIAASVANDVSSFEWLAHVHELFHMRLMNMNYQVGAKTIDR